MWVITLLALITHDNDVASNLKHEIYAEFNIFDNNPVKPNASTQKEKDMTEKEQTLYDLFGFGANHANYLINISKKYKYIYFETPKVGCSTIKNTLQRLEVDDESELPPSVHDKHLSPLLSPLILEKNFTEYLNDEYFKFSFVRNPYTRILSCYLDKILGIEKDIILPKLGYKSTDHLSFKDFLLAIKKQSYLEMDVHWMPQSILLAAENITLDFIGRQENFDNDLKKVLARITKSDSNSLQILDEIPHAVGANKKLKKYLTKDIARLIQEIYYDDFHLYRYNTNPFYTGQLPTLPIKRVDTSTESNLVSIVIPCYNQAQYLEESVQSAVDQTYSNVEIIIVNDGSSDNTQVVAERLQKKHPELIRVIRQENQGLSEARNNGIRASLGEYILPLDADDILDLKMVSKCMDAMIHNNADIIHGGLQCFGENNNVWMSRPFSDNNILYENLPHGSSLYRKEVWGKTQGYKLNMAIGYEDWEFWINAYKHNFTFHYLSEILYNYRIKKESMYTNAKDKDTYLKSKIIINNPELYPILQVQEAITKIRETEELADLYFYYDENIPGDKKILLTRVGYHIAGNPSKKKQIIIIDDKKIGLCALELLQNAKSIQKLYKKMGVDFLLFYAPLRYEVPSLQNLDFAWDKNKGIIKVHGNIFPFVSKLKKEDHKSQLLAYARLVRYQDKLFNTQKQQLENQTKMIGKYKFMMKTIQNVIKISITKSPIHKYKAYKIMLKTYFNITKS